jgi:hypothetical protein
MASKQSTWRDHPFEIGKAYIVQKTIDAFPSGQFVAGRHYVLDYVEYSPYDSSTVFQFHTQDVSNTIFWWWHDDQPESLCSETFKVIDANCL